MSSTIIAGSRNIQDYELVKYAIEISNLQIDQIISGGAKGVDILGERYAKENNIPFKRYPANWGRDGKRAGFLRNQKMAENADTLIAIWDGESKGTEHMISIMRKMNKKIFIFNMKNIDLKPDMFFD